VTAAQNSTANANTAAAVPAAPPPRAFTQPPSNSLHLAPAEPFGAFEPTRTEVTTQSVQPQSQLPSLPPAIENPPAEHATATIRRITSLEELEAAYAKQPTLSKAVEIAETYLNRNDFQNAYNWALKANEMDGQEERSWEVFAKASYKMGRKDRAINALRAYLDTRYSERLNRLLAQMEADTQ
jgi:tetratricopeptide (TPR) repeat protein